MHGIRAVQDQLKECLDSGFNNINMIVIDFIYSNAFTISDRPISFSTSAITQSTIGTVRAQHG